MNLAITKLKKRICDFCNIRISKVPLNFSMVKMIYIYLNTAKALQLLLASTQLRNW